MNFLSVVIPAYNEGARIIPTIQAVAYHCVRQPYRWEIVVVNDGSRDDTAAHIERLARTIPQMRVLHHVRNRGKGAAIRTGLLEARGEAVLFCDADGATPIEELSKLLVSLGSGAAMSVGSRRVPGAQVVFKQPGLRRFMSNFYPRICRILLRLGVADVTCGFKLLSQEAARVIAPRMRIARWSFDAEIFVIAGIHGFQVTEIPVRWTDQRKSKVRLLKDAWGSFRELFQIRSNARKGLYR